MGCDLPRRLFSFQPSGTFLHHLNQRLTVRFNTQPTTPPSTLSSLGAPAHPKPTASSHRAQCPAPAARRTGPERRKQSSAPDNSSNAACSHGSSSDRPRRSAPLRAAMAQMFWSPRRNGIKHTRPPTAPARVLYPHVIKTRHQ